mmetsp:Transcript_13691/g.38776  ORF Transcript_13691/g.38776 Transcript_13691/m.38776 type:complete len:82 (+) Transcript_13691:664-909(+)
MAAWQVEVRARFGGAEALASRGNGLPKGGGAPTDELWRAVAAVVPGALRRARLLSLGSGPIVSPWPSALEEMGGSGLRHGW